jgi:uncharacterized membrane protein
MSATHVLVSARPARRPRRLGTRGRGATLVAHIGSAGAWFGIDVAMAVLIVTATTTGDPATRAVCLQALELVAVWPLLVSGLLCLATGLLLGLGGKWGVARYWWVAVKLVLNLVLTALVLLVLRSEVAHQAELARQWATGVPVTFDLSELIYPPTVSPALLLVAFTLSVVKPWGRIRRPLPRGGRPSYGAPRGRDDRRPGPEERR